MDSTDLLARENEFKKLNRQLEKKTESLMKEIENVMQKQDTFSDFSRNLSLTSSAKNVQCIAAMHCCNSAQTSASSSGLSVTTNYLPDNKAKKCVKKRIKIRNNSNVEKEQTPSNEDNYSSLKSVVCHNCMLDRNGRLNDDIEFLYAFVSINVKDNVLPQSFTKERVTVENVCKFLSAKVKLLQEQVTKMHSTMDKKVNQCESHIAQLAELESEKLSLLNKCNKSRADATESKTKCMALLNQIEEKERLYKEQRSIADKLSSELKKLKGRGTAVEARCAALEEAETTLKHQLAAAKTSHQEFRDSSRALSASQESAISRLEGRIKQLTNCIQKQNALIDNLKQQNHILSLQNATAALESDYLDFLKQDL